MDSAGGRKAAETRAGRGAAAASRTKTRGGRSTGFVTIEGVRLEVARRGDGPPLVLLAGEEMREATAPFLDALAADFEVIVPSPPGFGRSDRPDWITSVDDIAYLYLELMRTLRLDNAVLLGCSLGGWIAAEMATKDTSRLARLALVGPYGVKFGGVTDRDIADIWFLSPDRVAELAWADPAQAGQDLAALTDEALAVIARNLESFARFCWEPYLHNPKLRYRLGRIDLPTLLIWGEADGIVPVEYGRRYQKAIPGAQMKVVRKAGHYPHLERPDAVLKLLNAFVR